MKKIIISLLIGVIILGVILIIILRVNKPQSNETNIEAKPTGIIIPTRDIKNNELDIVNIDPKDNDTNINQDKKITITFSKNFNMNDIEFFLSPKTDYTTVIENNKLIITPVNKWSPGTTYSYSVNFPDNNQKVRLYSFTVSGPTPEQLPDTQPEGMFEEELNDQKQNNPDIYVTNNTPYENNFFLATSDFESKTPAHYYLQIISKTTDEAKVREEVNLWLQSLDLNQDQIDSLDIRYQ